MPERTLSSSPKKMSSDRRKAGSRNKAEGVPTKTDDDLIHPAVDNPTAEGSSGMEAVKQGLREIGGLAAWGWRESCDGIKTYVKKNHKKAEWLKDGYDADTDSIVFLTIITSACARFSGTQFFKRLRPLFMLLVWNAITPYLPEWFVMLFARVSFLVKNVATMWFMFNVYQALNRKVEDGEMEQQITIDKQEWTNEGTMETVQELQDIGTYDREQFWSFLKQQGIQVAIVGFMHIKYEYTTPLVFSSVLGLIHLMDLPLYKIYVQGMSVDDDESLKRPWKNMNDMGEQWKMAMQQRMGQGPAVENTVAKKKYQRSPSKLKAR